MKDIFDLYEVSDLPDGIVASLCSVDFERRVFDLIKMANRPLSIDEIMVGYYRKYKDVMDRRAILNRMFNITKTENSRIVKVGKGVYYLKELDK